MVYISTIGSTNCFNIKPILFIQNAEKETIQVKLQMTTSKIERNTSTSQTVTTDSTHTNTTASTIVSENKLDRFVVQLNQKEIEFFQKAKEIKFKLYFPPHNVTMDLNIAEMDTLKKIW